MTQDAAGNVQQGNPPPPSPPPQQQSPPQYQAPPQYSQPPHYQPPQQQDNGVLNQLSQQIAALPESIVNAWREATQPAEPPKPEPKQANKATSETTPPPKQQTEPQEAVTPGQNTGSTRERFVKWWKEG